jgi:hypothetical protein
MGWIDIFEFYHITTTVVIPTKVGIRYFQTLPGFRIKPGMSEKAVFQSSF